MSYLQIKYRSITDEINDIDKRCVQLKNETLLFVTITALAIVFEAMMFCIHKCVEKIKFEFNIHLKEWIMITLASGCLVAFVMWICRLAHGCG